MTKPKTPDDVTQSDPEAQDDHDFDWAKRPANKDHDDLWQPSGPAENPEGWPV